MSDKQLLRAVKVVKDAFDKYAREKGKSIEETETK